MVIEIIASIIIVMLLFIIVGTSVLSLIFMVKFIADPAETVLVAREAIDNWKCRWKEFLNKP